MGFTTKYSSTYTPEQNATAERANGSILSCARTLLHAASLPKRYWPYAVLYAADIYNCNGRVRLQGKTPYEMLRGKAPNVSRFRVFGCKAWALVPKAKRKKMDPRAKAGIFVGFSKTCSAYLVLVPSTGEVVESAHVLFDEASFGGEAPLPVTTFHETQSLWKSNRHPGIPLSDFHSNAALTPAEQAVQHRLERERKHAHVEE